MVKDYEQMRVRYMDRTAASLKHAGFPRFMVELRGNSKNYHIIREAENLCKAVRPGMSNEKMQTLRVLRGYLEEVFDQVQISARTATDEFYFIN